MTSIKQFIQQLTLAQLAWIAITLSIPAFLINLGAVAFIGDEAIRTLVAFEMKHSGNFLVPTLNGIEYYNKPPLYNWIIYFTSHLFGYFGEWPTRLPTIFFLGLYGIATYYFTRKHFDKLTSVTMAFMLVTSGRILFWDSMLGLIDTCFSFVVFLNFMVLFHFGAQRKWYLFFGTSYLLFAIAFLLKGLPAVVFQGISIVTALVLHGAFRQKFFSIPHVVGIVAGMFPLLAYYIPYADQVSIENVFSILLDQSMQRTGTHHGVLKTLLHLLTFPFEQVYHFLPWSLLIIMFMHSKFRTWMNSHPFVRFNFWMMIMNILVYWFSVQVYPRYLLMFLPLFNITTYYILQQSLAENKNWWKTIRYAILFLAGAATFMVVLMPVDLRVREIDGWWFIWITGAVIMTFFFIAIVHDRARMFLWLCISLLAFRSVFNLIVLQNRKIEFSENRCREDCRRLGEKYGDRSWYIFDETETHQLARFYTSNYARQIIRKTDTMRDPSAYYLVDRALYPDLQGIVMDSLLLEKGGVLYLMQKRNE